MATYVKVHDFGRALHQGEHNLDTSGNSGNQLALALTNTSHTSTWANLSDLTEIAYTNLSNRNLTVSSSSQTAGTYSLVIADKTMTSTGGTTGPFQLVYVYNTVTGGLIGYYDFGSPQTIQDGQDFIFDLTDASNRLFTYA